jgi:hypothetical protein
MKFAVKGQAFSRVGFKAIGKVRTEVINTKTNILFKGIKTTKGVANKYEAFWNGMNLRSNEIVKVLSVKRKN